MSKFNAQAARAKRPCPIWVDAFQRDTQHLEADEIGAYFLILMAMWTRESCDFPDDDNRLARVSRVSTRLWKSRIGPVIRSFLTAEGGAVFSKRLREEATYVERQVKQQSDRKSGEKSDNPLKDIEPNASADMTVDEPGNHPSQQPNNPTEEDGGGGSAGARGDDQTLLEQVCEAAGSPLGKLTAGGGGLGSQADGIEVSRWKADLGLTDEEILANVREQAAGKPDGPPSRLSYFTKGLQRFAGLKARGPLTPIEGGQARASPGVISLDRVAANALAQLHAEDARKASRQ